MLVILLVDVVVDIVERACNTPKSSRTESEISRKSSRTKSISETSNWEIPAGPGPEAQARCYRPNGTVNYSPSSLVVGLVLFGLPDTVLLLFWVLQAISTMSISTSTSKMTSTARREAKHSCLLLPTC